MLDDLKTIFNNNNNNNSNNSNNNESDSENENESVNKGENENENKNENENESENEGENKSENENESDDEQHYEIKQINNDFKKIDETKSFKDQIDILKEVPWLNDYWYMNNYEDSKETNLRLFKLIIINIFNHVDDNLFKVMFGLTSVTLADKLINTTSKEKYQTLINDIRKSKDKILEQDEFSEFVIQPAHKLMVYLILLKLFYNLKEFT